MIGVSSPQKSRKSLVDGGARKSTSLNRRGGSAEKVKKKKVRVKGKKDESESELEDDIR